MCILYVVKIKPICQVMLGREHQSVRQSVSQHKILLNRKVLNAVETCWRNLELNFGAWLCLTNAAKRFVMKGN